MVCCWLLIAGCFAGGAASSASFSPLVSSRTTDGCLDRVVAVGELGLSAASANRAGFFGGGLIEPARADEGRCLCGAAETDARVGLKEEARAAVTAGGALGACDFGTNLRELGSYTVSTEGRVGEGGDWASAANLYTKDRVFGSYTRVGAL